MVGKRDEAPLTRRGFVRRIVRGGIGLAAAAALPQCRLSLKTASPGVSSPARLRPVSAATATRYVLVRFGGGVRAIDVLGPADRCLAPSLRAMSRTGIVYPNLWNGNLTRHDTATQYLLTGRYGTLRDSNDAGPENLVELDAAPTIFEAWRKATGAPLEKALAIGVPPVSRAADFGRDFRALAVATPARIKPAPSLSGDPSLGTPLETTMGNQRLGRAVRWLAGQSVPDGNEARRAFVADVVRQNLVGDPLEEPLLDGPIGDALVDRIMNDAPFIQAEESDDWVLDLALRSMRALRPDLSVIAFSTPDLAHSGAWRSYAAQVRRIDFLLATLLGFLSTDTYYKGRTAVLVTTDCGRGDPRFDQHAAPFDAAEHRRTFLVASGPTIKRAGLVNARREQIDVPVTLAAMLGIEIPGAEGTPLEELTW